MRTVAAVLTAVLGLLLAPHAQALPTCAEGAAIDDPARNAALVADCDTLLGLQESLAGDASLNWDADLAIAEWEGVTVSRSPRSGSPRRVTSLQLAGKGLTGVLPPVLGDLTGLDALSLAGNELSGGIPNELVNLANLSVLALDDNNLTGSIPSDLGNLTTLIWLGLHINDLTGSIPPELGDLTNLTALNLYQNRLSGSIPPELGNLTELTVLWLNNNELTGTVPRELGSLTELENLSLYGNQLSGSIPIELGDLANLVQLGLYQNRLSGPIPPELGRLSELTWLGLSENDLSGDFPDELGDLTNLEWLYLQNNNLTGCIPESLRGVGGNLGGLLFCGDVPGTPAPPTVEAAGVSSLLVSWEEPVNTGAAIADYDVRYRPIGSLAFTDSGFDGTATFTTITGLWPAITYEVQVRSTAADGTISPWSGSGFGTTDAQTQQLTVTISGPEGPVGGVFEVTITFSDDVTGFEPNDLSVAGGSATLTGRGATYTATITPTASGTVTVDVPAGVAQDAQGTENQAAAQYRVTVSLIASGSACATDGTVSDPENNPGLVADCETLLAAKATLAGDASLNWSADLAISDWEGVLVIGSPRRVTKIQLRGIGLKGTISPELGNLTHLVRLDFVNNQLHGGIPGRLGELTQLESLVLSGNKLSGSVPPELGNLARLKYLRVTQNQLSGSIPLEIGRLTNLLNLGLGSNQLTGSIPVELKDLTSLRQLALYDNELTGEIPGELGQLTMLRDLELDDNQLGGSIPSELGNLAGLEKLWLFGNELSGAIPPELGALSQLKWLDLSHNQLTGSIPGELGSLSDLLGLILNNNQLSGDFPGELGALTALTQLFIQNNDLTGCIPAPFRRLEQVTSLGLQYDFGGLPFCDAAPGQPAAPTVAAAGANSLTVSWEAPEVGDAAIDHYSVQYREVGSAGEFTDSGYDGAETATTITELTAETSYEVQVRATDTDGDDGLWSESGVGATEAEAEPEPEPEPACATDGAVSDAENNPGLVTDCETLLSAKTTLAGSGALNWSASLAMSEWDGTGVGGSPTRVIELTLGERSLNGSIPSELGALTQLQLLYVNNNQLSGAIPEELGGLTTLTDLRLNANALTGNIPSELGDLTALRVLNLGGNELTGEIPPELGNLTQLALLRLSGNPLSGGIPSELGDLTALMGLALIQNGLSGEIPPELGDLTLLQVLLLRENQLSGGIPSEFGNLTALVGLELNDNQLTGSIPRELGNLTALEVLLLHRNELTGSIPSELGSLTALATLQLNDNQLSGDFPIALGELAALDRLYIQNNDLSGCIPESLQGVGGNLGGLPFCNAAPGQPAAPTVAAAGANSLTVSWEAPEIGDAAIDHYSVQYREEGSAGEFTDSGYDGAETATTITELTAETSYEVQVRATDTDGDDGLWSESGVGATEAEAEPEPEPEPEPSCATDGAVSDPENNPGLVADCETLLAAKATLAGDASLNWSANLPMSLWVGVRVEGSPQRVVWLLFYEHGLSGVIPPELGDLTHLTRIFIRKTQLGGSIPGELGNLANLTELDLRWNGIGGPIPAELGNLTNLTRLNLDYNELSGAIPPELGNLTNLTRLSLNDNELSGAIPAELGNLTNLTSLSLYRNELSGAIPPELANLANLTSLGLWGNELSGSIPSELGNLTNLTALALSHNRLSGNIPPELSNLTGLSELNLRENELSGGIPSELANLVNLTSLDLSLNGLSGSIPSELANLGELEYLTLSENELSGSIPSELGNLTELKHLSLSFNELSGSIPSELGNLGQLTQLSLGINDLSGAIPREMGNLSSLERLDIRSNQLSGSIPSELGNLTKLSGLYLGRNGLSGAIPRELGDLPLRQIFLDHNELSGAIPGELGDLTALHNLRLNDNELSGNFPNELGALTGLEWLYIENNDLTGCIPASLSEVEGDFGGLPFCDGETQSMAASLDRAESPAASLATVSFGKSRYTVDEGDSVTVTVTLEPAATAALTVPITVKPSGGTSTDDYSVTGLTNDVLTLTFAAGDDEATFAVAANHDADAVDETVVISFGTLPEEVVAAAPLSATVTIVDDDRSVMQRITRANEAILPRLAQAGTASTLAALSDRIDAAAGDSRHVQSMDLTGFTRLYQRLAASGRAGEVIPAVAVPRTLQQIAGELAFALPVAATAKDGPGQGLGISVWGSGDYGNLEGGAGAGSVTWTGDVFSAHLGVDGALSSKLLAGVALSWSRGEFEYTDRHDATPVSGRHTDWMLSAFPYLSWSPGEALGLWATVGYGWGQLEIEDAEADAKQTSDSTRWVAAAGARGTLADEQLLPGGTTTLDIKTEAFYALGNLAGNELLIEPLAVEVWRARVAFEAAHEWPLQWGSRITPELELAGRYDGGDGRTGAGLELGGGLSYMDPAWGLTVEGRGRVLLAHQADYREWGAGGTIRLDLGADRRGLSMSVSPSYGQTASGATRLWERGASTWASAGPGGRLNAELRYGIPAGEALVTPYAGFTLADGGSESYRLGGKVAVDRQFDLSVEGEHRVPSNGPPQQRVLLSGTLRL